MQASGLIKSSFSMYLNEEKLDDDYIDKEDLVKASEQVHQFFDREVTIKLSNGYGLVFDPIGASSSFLVSKILASDAGNLQNFIGMLRFRRVRIIAPIGNKKKWKIAAGITYHLMKIHGDYDLDGFTSYNPEFIPGVLGELKKVIMKIFERNDFSDIGIKLKESEIFSVYQLYQEILYVLDLFYA